LKFFSIDENSAGLPIFPKPSHHDIETNHRPYKSVVFFSKMELCKVLKSKSNKQTSRKYLKDKPKLFDYSEGRRYNLLIFVSKLN
ncbi:hypothetical protein, partial [Brevibacillus agri]|uniref:hypothetical protein n=1 Tax=Brevibacillus agri TaxID=51101 RepID=UPI0030F47EF8